MCLHDRQEVHKCVTDLIFSMLSCRYLLSKPQWWAPDFTLNVMEMTEGKRMKLTLGLKHTMNFQDLGERFKRKGELQYELKSRCTKLEIDFKPPAGEVNVNFRQEGPHEISLRKVE